MPWALDGRSYVLVEPNGTVIEVSRGVISQNLGMVSEWKMSFAAIFDAVFVAVLDVTVPLAATMAAISWCVVRGFAVLTWLGSGPVHFCFQTPSCEWLAGCDGLVRC